MWAPSASRVAVRVHGADHDLQPIDEGVHVGEVFADPGDDYLFVLVPGDRQIAWPKLRALLGVKRLSMPNAETAREVTGYERGTITPFGSLNPWPVVADARVDETVSIGGGAHGVSATVAAADLIRVLNADIADVTDPL